MTFSQVVKLIDPLALSVHAISDGNAEINDVRFAEVELTEYREDTLYFCEQRDLPAALPPRRVHSFIVIGELSATPSQFHNIRVNLVSVSRAAEPLATLGLIRERLSEENRVRNAVHRLTEALLSNKGLHHLVETAYAILGNPILVWDSSEHCLARVTGDSDIDPESMFGTFLASDKEDRESDLAAVAYLKKLRQSGLLSSGSKPARFLNELFNLEQLDAPVRVNGIIVAEASMFAYNHSFTAFDEAVFEQLLSFISQELQKRNLFRRNRDKNKAYFLNALLSYTDIKQANIDRMLLIREIATIKEKFYVAVIEMSPFAEHVDSMVFQMLAQQLRPILSGSFYLIRETELVILFNLPNNKQLSGFIDETLRQQAIANKLLIGVSNMFHDLTQTRKHYQQAKEAIILNNTYNDWTVTYFSLIAPVRVLHIVREHDDLISYCMPELMDLLAVDKQSNTDYMTTLYCYLEFFGNTSAAAAKLHIHKNTLLYRLSKIRDILHCSLEEGEDNYKLMMSFRILRILGMFGALPPEPTETGS